MRCSIPVLASLVVLLAVGPAGAQNVNTLRVEGGTVPPVVLIPGSVDTFTGTVLIDNEDVLQGWSFGLCSDDAILQVDAFAEGAIMPTINGGGPAGFLNLVQVPGGVTMGVVIDLFGVNTLNPGVGAEVLVVDYSLLPGVTQPPPGDPDLTTQVAFCDTIGDPAVATVVVVGGASLVPDQVNLDIIIPAEPIPADCEFLQCAGGVDFVDLQWNGCTNAISGVADYYLLFRDGVLLNTFTDGTMTYNDPGLAPGSYTYQIVAVSFINGAGAPDPQAAPDVLTASCTTDVIPVTLGGFTPTEGLYQGGTMLTLTGTGFDAAPDTTVLIGGQTALNIVVVDDTTITCETPAVDFVGPVDVEVTNSFGNETIPDGFLYGFIRGLISDDLLIDIADPVFALTYLFDNGPAPFCFDATDTNDSGFIDIADPVYLLTYLFAGAPEPPAPFATPGLDPTDGDGIGCGNPPPGMP